MGVNMMQLEERLKDKPDKELKNIQKQSGLENEEKKPGNGYPEYVYNTEWLKKADPYTYKSWLISKGHEDSHINKQFCQYIRHYFNIAEKINDY